MNRSMAPMALVTAAAAALLALAAAPAAGQTGDAFEAARQVAEAREHDRQAIRAYSWTSRTEVKIKGEVKVLRTELVRYTLDGAEQRTPLSSTEPQAKGGGGPPLPPAKIVGGVKKKKAKKKIQQQKDWAADLIALVRRYSLPTAGATLDFFTAASIGPGDAPQALRIHGTGVVQPGDVMTTWVDTRRDRLLRTEVGTALEGDAVTLVTEHRALDTGLSYMARALVKVPSRQVQMTIENFDYNRD